MKKLTGYSVINIKVAELYRNRILAKLDEAMDEAIDFSQEWHIFGATKHWVQEEADAKWMFDNRKKDAIEIAFDLYTDGALSKAW